MGGKYGAEDVKLNMPGTEKAPFTPSNGAFWGIKLRSLGLAASPLII